ncbi:hypothetical protein [Pseudonocardia asaccharolytica]|uniref:Uncharacterized protein n=1 Tax=Pseudonocardia asaccharolytica DSM 44247 = NBRC 16224 TaxID=1123024 RepID=A0A511CYN8_9PSEU|nr:hypothetical protein [Pseudonocardia asaccharolytica]GEL17670.1 hypothetical protein PA7_15070 [Pseudonocardia asaccharolytica DSM 44247 = NBRC 16224]
MSEHRCPLPDRPDTRILDDDTADLVADIHAIADHLDTLGAAGARDALRRAADTLVELAGALERERRYRTLGGPPPPCDRDWANLAWPPPPSASDPAAPPLHRPTRDEAPSARG